MKNKFIKLLSFLALVVLPTIVFADDFSEMGIFGVLSTHFMLTLHSAIFFCLPVSMIFGADKASEKKLFWKLFWIRAVVVIILAFIDAEVSVVIDAISIFAGGFIGFPISGVVAKSRNKTAVTTTSSATKTVPAFATQGVNCSKCGAAVAVGNMFCTKCGTKVTLVQGTENNKLPFGSTGTPFGASSIFGYNMTEEQMVTAVIEKEIAKNGDVSNVSIAAVERRKTIFSLIYAIITAICVSLFFFHSNTGLLIFIFIVITFIYFNMVRKYNLLKYLQKEVKARPDEKIGYIVSTVLAGKVNSGGSKIIRLAFLIVAIAIPMFIFRAPYTMYEYDESLEGYVIRFYTIGWLEKDEELEIPEEYKGEPVVGIRGEVFANVKSIRKVTLPSTIKEIRGQAFQYASNLEEINIPEGIVEIKGNTFEDCNLKEITIPDSVMRIGGHAFRSNGSLEKVNISPNSHLNEIGSSAFRDCYSLKEIYLPRDVYVNERAFKGSGTNIKEYNGDGIVLEDKYKYDNFIYIKTGDSQEINEFHSDAKLQGASVKLVSVGGYSGNYKFKIDLTGGGYNRSFYLSKDSSYVTIDDNVAIEVTNDYVFNSYSDSVSFTVYYN